MSPYSEEFYDESYSLQHMLWTSLSTTDYFIDFMRYTVYFSVLAVLCTNTIPVQFRAYVVYSGFNSCTRHFRVNFNLCFKTRPRAKPFLWKRVWFAWKTTCRGNTLSLEWFCTKLRSDTGSKGTLEVANCLNKNWTIN